MNKFGLTKRLRAAGQGFLMDPSRIVPILDCYSNTLLDDCFDKLDGYTVDSYEANLFNGKMVLTYHDVADFIWKHWPKGQNKYYCDCDSAESFLEDLAQCFINEENQRDSFRNTGERKYRAWPIYQVPLSQFFQAISCRYRNDQDKETIMDLYHSIRNFMNDNPTIKNYSENLLKLQPRWNRYIPDITTTVYTMWHAEVESIISYDKYLDYCLILVVIPFIEMI